MKHLITFLLLLIPLFGISQPFNYTKYNNYDRSASAVNGEVWRFNDLFHIKLNGTIYQLLPYDATSSTVTVDNISSNSGVTLGLTGLANVDVQAIGDILLQPNDDIILNTGDDIYITDVLPVDNTETVFMMRQASDGEVQTRTYASLGIPANSGTTNEVLKSDGTNIVGTGVFTSTAGSWSRTGNFSLNATGNNSLITTDGSTIGQLGITGTSGAGEFQNITSATSTVDPTFTVHHSSTGTPATGTGTSIQFTTETSANNHEIGGVIESVYTDVTSTSEDADLVLKTMAAGATASEKLRVKSDGKLVLSTAPTTDNTETAFLVRQSDGEFQQREETISTLYTSTTQTGLVGAGPTTLFTYTLPAGTLTADGQALKIASFGTLAGNTNSKVLSLTIGGSPAGSSGGLSSASDLIYSIELWVVRSSSTTAKIVCSTKTGVSNKLSYTSGGGFTWGSSNAIVLSATGTSNNDVVGEVFKVLKEL